MKTIETQWIKDPTFCQNWGKAKIYKTKGGKLALKHFFAYAGGNPANHHASYEPCYYSSVQGCFRALGYLGLEQGITLEDIKEVMES